MLIHLLRSRAFAIALHLALWILVILAAFSLRGKAPRFVEATASARTPLSPVPANHMTNLFVFSSLTANLGDTNAVSPFLTRHFIPPVVPPPPPPTTRQIAVTYHGFYQTGDDPTHAFLAFDAKTVTRPAGGELAPTWFVAAISQASVALTNTAGHTNTILLNKTVNLEVPAP